MREPEAWAAATSRMIPERAVWSPTAVTRTRRLPPLATVPAMTLAPAAFGTRFGLAGDHGLVNIGSALNDSAICGNTGSGPHKHDVANTQFGKWNGFACLHPSRVPRCLEEGQRAR